MMRLLLVSVGWFLAAAFGAQAQSINVSIEPDLSDYRQIGVVVLVDGHQSNQTVEIRFGDEKELHTELLIASNPALVAGSGAAYQSCTADGVVLFESSLGQLLLPATATEFRCSLTGMPVAEEVAIAAIVRGEDGAVRARSNEITGITKTADTRLTPPDTRPVMYSLTGILLSLIVLILFLRGLQIRRGGKGRNAYFYVAPAMIGIVLLTFYPITYGIALAFTDAHQDHLGQFNFVGLGQFGKILGGTGLIRVSLFTAFWTITNVVFHVGLGLIIAMVLNRPSLKGKMIYRTILLLPWAVPAYITTLAWQGMLQPDGLVNDILGSQVAFLGEANAARLSVTLVSIWLGIPFMMMSLSGALKAIPTEMYEAADIDGISKWKQFRHITFPNLKGTLVPISLLGFIWSFNMFNTIFLLTRGGPYVGFGEPGATDIMVTYIFDVAFEYGDYGLAAAWSVALFLLLFAFSFFYVKQTRATEAA